MNVTCKVVDINVECSCKYIHSFIDSADAYSTPKQNNAIIYASNHHRHHIISLYKIRHGFVAHTYLSIQADEMARRGYLLLFLFLLINLNININRESLSLSRCGLLGATKLWQYIYHASCSTHTGVPSTDSRSGRKSSSHGSEVVCTSAMLLVLHG